MSQGLKADNGTYVAAGDSGAVTDRIEVSPPMVRVAFRSDPKPHMFNQGIWQAAENMRKSVDAFTDLLVRTSVEKTRARFLVEANGHLWSSPDEETMYSTLSNLFVPMLADGVCIFSAHDGSLQRRALAHEDPKKEALVMEFAEGLIALAAKRVEWLEPILTNGRSCELSGQTLTHMLTHSSASPVSEALLSLDIRWLEAWPLVSKRRVIGAIFLFGTTLRTELDVGSQELLQSLTHCAGLALANARDHERSRQAICARESLMAMAAHDLRNSLSLAMMSLSTAEGLGELPNGSLAVSRMVLLRRGLERMLRLVDDLLDYSCLETGHLSLVATSHSVATLVEEVVETFHDAAAQKNIRLAGRPLVDGCQIVCDGFRLLQVLSNLVGNALKFTPNGGEVVLEATDGGGEIEFSVADTGCGISPADLPHVFEAYRRTSRVRSGGVGLGLSIAKGIVQSHGGRIWVESHLGEGTTFFFRVPKQGPPSLSSEIDQERVDQKIKADLSV
jgi:signal transduction histidine kinase